MATGEKRATEQADRSLRLWPYNRKAALPISLLLLIVLVLALIGLRQATALPGDRIGAWLLLGAVLLSLVPVFLIVLDRVAESAGTVEAPGGVKISFAAVEMSARIDIGRTTISGNLGSTTPGVQVTDTEGTAILQALKPVLGSDVAVLDLGEGQEWWQTRLLLLTSGATRLGNPRVLVFIGAEHGRTKQFVGWGRPSELLRTHLRSASPTLQQAYRNGQSRASQWALGEPSPSNDKQVTLPWGDPLLVPSVKPEPQLIPEHFLLSELATLEPPGAMPDLAVTVPLLRGLFNAVLREDRVERNAPDEKWRDAILGDTDDYLAVTERGAYITLVSRQAAVNAVLRSLIPADSAPADATDTRSGR